jgi:NAD(P)-dependent dehydrogenase (short-subunit alcohol dehydrogenase family)
VGGGPDSTAREVGADGHELRLTVNYLAPVALTRALLPVLRARGTARIVDVGSAGQEPLDFDDPEFTRGYDGVAAYCRSKFALAAHTFTLAGELAGSGVAVNVVHPATHMDTAMVRDSGFTPRCTVADGAPGGCRRSSRRCPGRGWRAPARPARAHPAAYDPQVRARLAALTERMLAL